MLFGIATCYKGYGQDPYFSQFYNSPMLTNPALTGISYGDIRFIGHYKNYLATIEPFQTYSFTADMSLLEGRPTPGFGGVGLMFMNNVSGADLRNTQVMASLAYHIAVGKAGKTFLALGVQGGVNQTELGFGGLRTQSQWVTNVGVDPSLANGEPVTGGKISLVDYEAGLLWYSFPSEKVSWFIGAAAYHLTEPEGAFTVASSTLSRRYVGHAGVRAEMGTKVAISPNAIFMQQNGINVITAGMSLEYRFTTDMALNVSSWIRNTDVTIFGGGLDYKSISVSLSYDMLVSDLSDVSDRGGFEFSLTYYVRKHLPSTNRLSANPNPRL